MCKLAVAGGVDVLLPYGHGSKCVAVGSFSKQQYLNFRPELHGHGSLRPVLGSVLV